MSTANFLAFLSFLFLPQIQIIGYNSDLYQTMNEASVKPNGLVGIALLVQVITIIIA